MTSAWSCTVPAELVPEYESKLQIAGLRSENNGSVSIRYLPERSHSAASAAAFVICAAVHILVVNSLFGWECTKISIQVQKHDSVPGLRAGVLYCASGAVHMAVQCPPRQRSIQASILYAITDFQFLSLGGLTVWTPYAMIGACIIEIPLFAFLAVCAYCRHIV